MYCTIGCAASPSSVAAPMRPVLDRLAVHDDEMAEAFRNAQHAIRNLAARRQNTAARRRARTPRPSLSFGLSGHDRAAEVEHAPVADRIVDHVPAGPGPERRVGVLQVLRHLGGRNGGAKDDRAGRQRIAVADDALSHIRIDAVGADQRGRGDALAAVERRPTRRICPARNPSRGYRCEARSGRARGRRRAARRGCAARCDTA